MMFKFLFKVLLASCISVLIISCSSADKNRLLPNFKATTLSGDAIYSKDLQNKVVVLNFWATSCSACIAEMPKLIASYNEHKQAVDNGKLVFIAVAMPYDNHAYVANFTRAYSLPFAVAIDNDENITKSFSDINLTPTTFVFNQGKLAQKYIGEPGWENFNAMLKDFVAKM
jgi:thiol-disulfide isomerase/thioredoxin